MKNATKFTNSDFIVLYISYYKLAGNTKLDVVKTCYALSELFFIGKYEYLFQDFTLRKDKNYKDIIDIDGALMDAYIFGHIDYERNIMLQDDDIKNNILPRYPENVCDLMNDLVKEVIERLDKYPSSNENYVNHLFYQSKSNGRR